jgi:hypothetical protein
MRFCTSGMWGIANYFAVNASYSVGYAHTNKEGDKQMFYADVIIGDTKVTNPDANLRMPPFIEGQTSKRYDSV